MACIFRNRELRLKQAAFAVVFLAFFSLAYGQEQQDYVSPTIGSLSFVPAGQFQRDEKAGNVSVISRPFRMSRHEISRGQFQAVMGTDPSNPRHSSGTADPVMTVNWYHAMAFCNKLSLAEGLTPVYAIPGVDFSTLACAEIPIASNAAWDAVSANWSADGYRLPTEMEWMWAAMGAPADGQGGKTNTTGYLKAFAGSSRNIAIGDYAVFGWFGNEAGRTRTDRTNPAGSKKANELGLYDMSGNVWEWCWDWFAAYPSGTLTDYRGAGLDPASPLAKSRVLRGGSWNSAAPQCTLAYRNGYGPGYKDSLLGFRVVRF